MYTPRGSFGRDLQTADLSGGGPFLDRARTERAREREGSSRLALGAYLVVRVAHGALPDGRTDAAGSDAAALRWQLDGALRYVEALPAEEAERAHLHALVAALAPVTDEGAAPEARAGGHAALRRALGAYAGFLEEDGRVSEALEIVTLAERVRGDVPLAEETLPLALTAGRLHALQMHWEEALAAYRRAAEAAAEAGDGAASLQAWLGQAGVLRGQGRRAEARAEIEAVVQEAGLLERCDLAARAYTELAALHAEEGRTVASLQALYQAVVRTDDPARRGAMLAELARGLRELGAWDGARAACELVLALGARGELRLAAHLELLLVEAGAGDQVAFERQRQAVRALAHWMTPELVLEERWRVVQGLARFEQPGRAREALREAMALAEAHRLPEWYFRLEQCAEALAERAAPAPPAAPPADPAALQLAQRVRAYAAALVA
ncbi:MAG TPA: hypothetical protein VFS40_07205 [Gemmatimonadales bacterium]|nr:hypothetical protein [Gemmatimonadales bacterium]